MGTTVDDKIVKWLTRLLSCQTENGRISRVELMHTSEGEPADRIIALGIEEEQNVQELAQELWDLSENDASTRGVGMPQRYVIRLFDTPQGDDHLAMHPFTVRGRAAGPYLGSDTEPANERGVLAQFMRTVENQNRLLVHNAAAVSSEMDRAISRARAAEDRELETRRLHQDLLDRGAEREIEKAKELMRARRTDQLIGTVLPLVPLLLTKLLQGSALLSQSAAPPVGLPAPQTPRDAATEAFLKQLSIQEMQGVMAALKGVNQLTMVELYKTYQNPASGQSSQARDVTIGNLLKALSGEEIDGILRALTEMNREAFVQIHTLYVEAHEEEQKGMPEVLRDEVEKH